MQSYAKPFGDIMTLQCPMFAFHVLSTDVIGRRLGGRT